LPSELRYARDGPAYDLTGQRESIRARILSAFVMASEIAASRAGLLFHSHAAIRLAARIAAAIRSAPRRMSFTSGGLAHSLVIRYIAFYNFTRGKRIPSLVESIIKEQEREKHF
jgi:hypothetical protein